jgi:hypothetical protein
MKSLARYTGQAGWIVLALLCAGVVTRSPAAIELNAPRQLEYRIAWNGISAAQATINVTPERYAGDLGYVISADASTNALVDLFWRFRGTARATVLADRMIPLRFSYQRRTNSTPELTWIDFPLGAGRAESVYIKRERRKELEVEGSDLLDPITAAFRALSSDVRVGDELTYSVFTGETHYRVLLSVRGEEVVEVPAGRFEALRVEPEIIKIKDEERRDKRVRRAMIWVSRAPLRNILRIRSEIFVGAITLDLVRSH